MGVAWLLNPPSRGGYENALIAIASVSAVLWTGGLIIRQLNPFPSVQMGVGMEHIGFAFLAPMFALFMQPLMIRAVVGVFFVY